MKPVTPSDLVHTAEMSLALHLRLSELQNCELRLSARRFCKIAGLHTSDLTRMRLVHQNPHYGRLISRRVLKQVLVYLLEQFPTLVICRSDDDNLTVHLYRYYNGKRLRRTLRRFRPPVKPFRQSPKEGTTRWFMKMSG